MGANAGSAAQGVGVHLGAGGEAMAGAEASADGELAIDPVRGAVAISGKASAFAGVKASGHFKGGTTPYNRKFLSSRERVKPVPGRAAKWGHEAFDAVVLANGAWLNDLARPHGVSMPVRAGRGYSFTVQPTRLPAGPLYFPSQRVACTPVGDRLRIGGMMEFRSPDAGLDPRRITAITNAVRPLLSGVDVDDRADEWVGARPCTTDGLPLIGTTRAPKVYVAGGHGMWGVTLGPATGQLLAQQIVTGHTPPELEPFEPLRRP